jgi:hypothetical protein
VPDELTTKVLRKHASEVTRIIGISPNGKPWDDIGNPAEITSVVAARAAKFRTLSNKIEKNLKIFVDVDKIRRRRVLCQL